MNRSLSALILLVLASQAIPDRASAQPQSSLPPAPEKPAANTAAGSTIASEASSGGGIRRRKYGLDIQLPPLRGALAGFEHNAQDGLILATDDDAAQKDSLYALNGINQWTVRRMGFHSAQSGSGVAAIIESQVYNGIDSSQGYTPTGRREYGAIILATSAFGFGTSNSYSAGGNWWNIDSNTIGPVQKDAAKREQWLSGGVFLVKKRAPGSSMDASHDGAVGILVSSTPAAGAGDAATDAAHDRITYPLNAGVRVHGWSGPQAAHSGNGTGATPMAHYGLWVGGVGGDVWSGFGSRALFNEVLRGEDFDTYGIHLLNGYAKGNAAFIEQSAGGVGIWQSPQKAIPLLVGADSASGLSASLFGDSLQPTTLRISRHSTAPAGGDKLGQIEYRGLTRDLAEVTYVRTQALASSADGGSYSGSYKIITAEKGALTDAITVHGSTTSLGGLMTLAGYTVGTLPKCDAATKGALAHATDVVTVGYNVSPKGGGENDVPVYCNGTMWTIH